MTGERRLTGEIPFPCSGASKRALRFQTSGARLNIEKVHMHGGEIKFSLAQFT